MSFAAQESNKVAIIGCGRVGMSAAFALLLQGNVNELVLHGRCKDNIIGEELDLEHGMAFLSPAKIMATEDYADIKDSDVVVITAGAAQQPGETRLDLVEKNTKIIEGIIAQVVRHAPGAVILMVTNPVDILTYRAHLLSGLPKGRVFGTGTTLDTARFRFHLSEFLHVNPKSIHAYILGEHGDSSFPVLSSASVGGQLLNTFPGYTHQRAMKAFDKARDAAAKIIASKGSTYYGIGVVISQIVKTILRDEKSVLPVSIPVHDFYGHYGLAISAPCVIGRHGVEQQLDVKLSWEEKQALDRSVAQLKKYL